ncbi:hypothetical protein [Caballeronia sp. HLA56]
MFDDLDEEATSFFAAHPERAYFAVLQSGNAGCNTLTVYSRRDQESYYDGEPEVIDWCPSGGVSAIPAVQSWLLRTPEADDFIAQALKNAGYSQG